MKIQKVTRFTLASLLIFASHTAMCAGQDSISVSNVGITLIRDSNIPAREAGIIAKLLAKEGKQFLKGEVIAELENDQQRLNFEAAGLALQIATIKENDELPMKTAEAQLREAEAGKAVSEVALKIAEKEAASELPIEIASTETQLRKLELERALKARESFKGSISKSQIDRLKTSLQKGELEIQQAKDTVEIQRLKPDAERAAISKKAEEIVRYQSLLEQEKRNRDVAKLTRQVQKNEHEIAKSQLEKRSIRAPFDGTVVKVERQLGEWVEPGTTIARLIDTSKLRASGFLSVNDARPSLVGRPVTIRMVDGKREVMVKGKVTFVSKEVDPNNQQVQFFADFDNRNENVRPGLTASLEIHGQ